VQFPYYERWKQANYKVSKGCNSTAQICNVNKDLNVNTFAMILIQAVPKVVDRCALEDGKEEEDQSSKHIERHSGIENANMDAVDCDAE